MFPFFNNYPGTDLHEIDLAYILKVCNEMLQRVREQDDKIAAVEQLAQELQDFVNNYFDNLDVQEEINSKINQMALDGTLAAILAEPTADAAAEWLANNITPTTPPVDATLTVSGAAADAKITGDALNRISGNIAKSYTVASGYYIDANGTIRNNATPDRLIRVTAKPGKRYCIVKGTATVMSAGCAGASVQSNSVLTDYTRHTSASSNPLYVTTNENDYYIYINLFTNADDASLKTIEANVRDLMVFEAYSEEIEENKDSITEIQQIQTFSTTGTVPNGYNFSFPVISGRRYKVTNNTAGAINLTTLNASNQTIQSAVTGLAAGDTAYFTALSSAEKIRIYFNGSGSVGIEYSIENTVNDLEYDYTFFASPATVPGGTTTEYTFNKGDVYEVINGTSEHVAVRLWDANNTVTQVIDEDLPAGGRAIFTVAVNSPKLRLFFQKPGSVFLKRVNNEPNETINYEKPITFWEIGGISYGDGTNVDSTIRLRSNFIPVGDFATIVTGVSGYQFIVFEYLSNDPNTNLIAHTVDDWQNVVNYYVQDRRAKYIRIAVRSTSGTSFSDTSAGDLFEIKCLYSTKAYNVKPITEDYNLKVYSDMTLETYSTTNKLSTLYAKWDSLVTAFPNIVTRETLGTINSKEMRCYTITPTPTMLPVTGADAYKQVKKLKLLFVSSIHGNEESIALDEFTFFDNLVRNHDPEMIWNNCIIKVIPTANPVGYDANTRNNGNNVNINRNFPTNWQYSTEEGNESGSAPGSEPETQILMDFINKNLDALIALNLHNTDGWSAGGKFGYLAGMYQSDMDIAYSASCAMDTELRKTYPNINTVQPNSNIFSLRYSRDFRGTFDLWFLSRGVHGYLVEFCVNAASYASQIPGSTCRRIRCSAIANLVKACIKNNEIIKSDRSEVAI